MINPTSLGYSEGDTCGRCGCKGIIANRKAENCLCHIMPPCAACTAPRSYCPVCDWDSADEPDEYILNDHIVQQKRDGTVVSYRERDLDKTKIDWISRPHTNSTMIKEGVYPPGKTEPDVLNLVKGTFGGRFEYFSGGRFKYIAYTD